MFDWFDEPIVYYRRFAPMRSGIFDYMARWMDSVDRAMEREFGDFYDTFYTPQITHENKKNDVKEAKEEKKEDPKKEEPKKEEEKPKEDSKEESDSDVDQYYSVRTSMYSGADGVQHIYREEHDSRSGQSKVTETRRIGNKSMTLHRVTHKDGKVDEHETRKNIKDDEVEAFKKDWEAHTTVAKDAVPAPPKNDAIEHKPQEKKEEPKTA